MIPKASSPRVVHLIPYDGIGGVEIAAKSIAPGSHDELRFERQYLVRPNAVTPEAGEYHGPDISLYDPRAYWHALRVLLRDPPDLLVASLWRSALVLIFMKVLRPRQRTVIFLHLAHDVHRVDGMLNTLAMRLADVIWTDSRATLDRRVPAALQHKGRVISFLLEKRPMPAPSCPAPEFVFWGRLNAQKGLDRALRVFAGIQRRRHDARFTVIGPDGGVEDDLIALAAELGIDAHVNFRGMMHRADITRMTGQSSFYLQTSLDEGMALSVVEAMQAGLVPVVTPVGEISSYCHDGVSAIFVHNDADAIDAVISLLSDPVAYKSMSRSAAEYWQARPLYRDDFLEAAGRLIKGRTDAC